jgi:hypothetical protein
LKVQRLERQNVINHNVKNPIKRSEPQKLKKILPRFVLIIKGGRCSIKFWCRVKQWWVSIDKGGRQNQKPHKAEKLHPKTKKL